MKERAIGKMVEWLEEWQSDYKKGPCSDVAHCLRKAKILALEEAKEKPTAPDSLVEDVERLAFPLLDGTPFGIELRRVLSRYHPSTQADIVGELKECLSGDNDYFMHLNGEAMKNRAFIPKKMIEEIIRKHEGAK